MKIPIEKFPYQPNQMGCCKECAGKTKKDCEPNPKNCIDFLIMNYDFIKEIELLITKNDKNIENTD